ncbi:MAG: hypothetical protein AB7T03_03520 [Bacilli bacterium]
MNKFEKRAKTYKITFFIVGLIIVPIYAIFFSQFGPGGDLIIVTFSQIGARYGAMELLIIWGILTSLYYLAFLSYLTVLTRFNNMIMSFLIGFGGLSMLVTVFLPFAPSMFPITSETHNFLAYVTAVSTLFALVVFVGSLFWVDRLLFVRAAVILLVIIAICLTVLIKFGVSSLFQIVFSTLLCLLLCLLLYFIEKSPHVDIIKALMMQEEQKEQK